MLRPLGAKKYTAVAPCRTPPAFGLAPARVQKKHCCWPVSKGACRATPEEQLAQLRGSKDERESLSEEASAQVRLLKVALVSNHPSSAQASLRFLLPVGVCRHTEDICNVVTCVRTQYTLASTLPPR